MVPYTPKKIKESLKRIHDTARTLSVKQHDVDEQIRDLQNKIREFEHLKIKKIREEFPFLYAIRPPEDEIVNTNMGDRKAVDVVRLIGESRKYSASQKNLMKDKKIKKEWIKEVVTQEIGDRDLPSNFVDLERGLFRD